MKIKILTPNKVVYEDDIDSITAPGSDGEFTVLIRHVPLFVLLKEGVLKVMQKKEEIYFSIGGGYLETDGKDVNVLVSRAFGQNELNEAEVAKAEAHAKKLLSESKTVVDRQQALALLRRSTVDMKMLSKVKRRSKSAGR